MKYSVKSNLFRFCLVPAFAIALSMPLFADDTHCESMTVQDVLDTESEDSARILVEPIQGEVKHINFRTALARAIRHSPDLKAAIARYEQARWDTKSVQNGHNPSLSFNAEYGFLSPEQSTSAGGVKVVTAHQFNYSASLVLQQAIYTFGRLHYAEAAAELTEQLKKEEYRKYYEAELCTTANYYVSCLLAQEQLSIAKQQLELREASLKDAEALFNAGTTAKFDVLRVRTSVSTMRQLVINAENTYRLAISRLCSRLGYPVDTQLELEPLKVEGTVPENIVEGLSLEECYESALRCRPELRMLDWTRKSLKANYDLVDVSNNPNLSLQSALKSTRDVGTTKGTTWYTGLMLSIPIYDRGDRHTQRGKLEQSMVELDHNLASATRSILLDVKNCFLNLQSSWESISQAQTSLEQALEADRVAQVRYNAGLSTSTELLDAHTALGTAQTALASAKYGYLAAIVDWVRAISGSYPIDAPEIIDPKILAEQPRDWYNLGDDSTFGAIDQDRVEEPCVEEIESDLIDKALHEERERQKAKDSEP